jgi:hypothetical protein
MPASKIKYIDSEGNVRMYVGDPRHFKKPKRQSTKKKKYANEYKKK